MNTGTTIGTSGITRESGGGGSSTNETTGTGTQLAAMREANTDLKQRINELEEQLSHQEEDVSGKTRTSFLAGNSAKLEASVSMGDDNEQLENGQCKSKAGTT